MVLKSQRLDLNKKVAEGAKRLTAVAPPKECPAIVISSVKSSLSRQAGSHSSARLFRLRRRFVRPISAPSPELSRSSARSVPVTSARRISSWTARNSSEVRGCWPSGQLQIRAKSAVVLY